MKHSELLTQLLCRLCLNKGEKENDRKKNNKKAISLFVHAGPSNLCLS